MATGVVRGLAIAAADHSLCGTWQAPPGLPPSIVQAWSAGGLIVGLLYGGVVEEVLFRWLSRCLVGCEDTASGRTRRSPQHR
ncbi:hypothetical protein DFH01_12700 [Falsiroseomonas bella]|uniref:Uncharacterized protein n=1 Tax=Falsiroseomonas bella TaxID=2184016 RepID=A0A317FAG2_9PROT|nr:hypothetical protein [Falsiroseomonas bella]PWS36064.1 hypothetical protein DFH01_12700 [Falsiroseomonas bella]